MDEYAKSWRHVKALLAGYTRRDSEVNAPSYEKQRHAKALSIFLTNAKLATPELNRETVEAVLSGQLQWPRTGGKPYPGTNIPLSRFEDLGLVSFYAGWCATHVNYVNDEKGIDSTLIPMIHAIEHLEDIRKGRNGCIQPHYACGESELKQRLQAEFGYHLSVEQLLPMLKPEGSTFKLNPGNQNFSSEISTQLWRDLRRNYAPEQTFNRWVRYFCVNCEWVMPVIFDRNQYIEREEFHDLLLKFLSEDQALATNIDCYVRQSINENDFSGLIRPTRTPHNIVIDASNGRSELTISEEELPIPTLGSLEEVYPRPLSEASSALEFVKLFDDMQLRSRELFYSSLVSTAVETSIRIDSARLTSSGFVEKLVALANTHRPVLKYLLYVILPNNDLPHYMTLLLARKETSDVAFFHLANQRFEHFRNQDTAYLKNLGDGYQQLLCLEYVKSIQDEPNFISRLVVVLKALGEQCALHSPDFFKGFEYRLLLTLLDSLTDQQVSELAQTIAEFSVVDEKSSHEKMRQHFRYLLGFWLIDRLERTGIDPTETICESVREFLRALYKEEFFANLAGLRSLEASSFFGTLSWKQIFAGVGQDFMLGLSSLCDEWAQKLAHQNQSSYGVALAVGHYLQVLIIAGQAISEASAQQTIATRVQEIIRLCGFKRREKYARVFEVLGSDRFDLWQLVCTYTNSFTDELYKDFIVRCAPFVPLNLLFVLLERTSVIARGQLLHKAIDEHRADSDNKLGLRGMEDVFTSAFKAGRTEIASRMLSSAKKMLAEDRFANTTHRNDIRVKKIWQSYEYKYQLIELYEQHRQDPTSFEKSANKLSIPHDQRSSQSQADNRPHHNECQYFRRELIATAFCDTNPARTVHIMEHLYKETRREHHGFVLLYGHVKLFGIDQNKLKLKSALTTFLSGAGREQPDRMDEYWVATVLEAYKLSGAAGIDRFWAQLSPEQQGRRLILTPYCRALLDRRDSYTVKKILARYKEINHTTMDELDIDELISELAKIEKDTPSMKDFLLIMTESSQRSVVQLQKYYNQIIAKDFKSYVEIVKPDLEPYEYLRDTMLAVAGELVLRKRNLQKGYKNEKGNISFKGLELEDWVNDWFVSLFEQRMSHAKISLRDQKRGGHSASGKNPGEIDGFITSSDNTRIGIFEAFRLFSFKTTTIMDHLNKIAGYDGESLNPVFMVGYCDVKNFPTLVDNYKSYVSIQEYKGYKIFEGTSGRLETFHDVDHIWMGSEIRYRGHKEVVFYHLLINLHLSLPALTTDSDELTQTNK